MKIIDFLHKVVEKKDSKDVICYSEASLIAQRYVVEKIAFWGIVNKIANVISKCEFETFVKGKSVKKEEYYLWNFEPNHNQNSNEFIKEIVSRLYLENECLIFEHNGQLFLADAGFTCTENGTAENVFSDISVKNKPIGQIFFRNEVIYLKLNDENVKRLIENISNSFMDLIQYTEKAYRKSRGEKGTLKINAMASQQKDYQERVNQLFNEDFKNYFNADNAVLPLFEGYEYSPQASKSYSNDNTRDIRALIDDVFDMTARALSFPPSLAKGDVQDTGKAVEEMLTFCVEPLAKMLETEINRARNGKGALDGTCLKINTKSIKHKDILDAAASIDKLIASGIYSINGILKLLGENAINEPWADWHFITKNYDLLDNVGRIITEGG